MSKTVSGPVYIVTGAGTGATPLGASIYSTLSHHDPYGEVIQSLTAQVEFLQGAVKALSEELEAMKADADNG